MRIYAAAQDHALEALPGQNLYRVLAAAGWLSAPCGGQGRCGKCGLRFISPPPVASATEQALFTLEQLRDGWRLSCLHTCGHNMEIELPPRAALTAEGAFWHAAPAPPADQQGQGLGLALDLGTTTLAATLHELPGGARLAAASCLNSQHIYGQDVISRIHHAASVAGLKELQQAVLRDIRQLLAELCQAAGLAAERITAASVAANPAMIHLLAGVDPSPLGQAPYQLALTGSQSLSAAALGLPLAPEARLYCLPALAAYVGGDVLGGLLATEFAASTATRLLLDIGTNGELVLKHQGQLTACSTAAGPALEGMNIRCGMRAAPGAVAALEIGGAKLRYSTIGGQLPPLGLAGSGLISAVSALRRAGLLDAGGRLQMRAPVREEGGQRQLVIDEAAGLVLTQADIRQMQLAKGAIRAGVETLLAEAHCPPQAVEQVVVAGGFGAHLKAEDLLATGLLPREFAGKINYVGNSALAGAQLCLLDAGQRPRVEELAGRMRYIELAGSAQYQQRFVQALRFDVQ